MTGRATGRVGFVVTLGALSAVSATAVDICLPAQPEIARALGASPTAGAALVGAYLLGYGPGQILWGPLSDHYGRLRPLTLALLGFLLASLACALASSWSLLVLARAVQGFMGGGAPVIARAIARDAGGGQATAKLISTMTMILGGAPLIAPSFGSGLLTLFDWRSVFWALVVFVLLLLASCFVFLRAGPGAETEPRATGWQYLKAIVPLFQAPAFVFGVAIMASIFCGYAALLAIGAAVAESRFGVAPEAFGPIFSLAALAFVCGSFIARRGVARFGPDRVITLGIAVAFLAGLGLAAAQGAAFTLPAFWSLVALYVFAFGLLLPTASAKALEPAGKTAGAASSIIGAAGVLAGALGAAVAGAGLFDEPYDALCFVMAASAFLCVALHLGARLFALRRRPHV